MHVLLLLASKSLSVQHSVEVVANLSFIGGRTEKCANSKRKALLLNFVGQKGFAALCSPCMHVVDPVKNYKMLNFRETKHLFSKNKMYFGLKIQTFW